MKHIDFEFNGKTYALSFTAEALFTIYDKFGYTADILGTTHVLEPTLEGWKNCCWLAALMASQGELQRRHRGESPQQMLTLEELRTGFMAADSVLLRQAVRDALEQGFHRDIPKPDEDEEVNLVLLEREEAEKKPGRRPYANLFPGCGGCSASPQHQRSPDAHPRYVLGLDGGADAQRGGTQWRLDKLQQKLSLAAKRNLTPP